MDEIKSILLEILDETRPDVDFEGEEALIDDKILSSFDIISVVSEINNEFDIKIKAADLIPENFNTVDAMCELIERLQDE
jgi:acyl carrier protein